MKIPIVLATIAVLFSLLARNQVNRAMIIFGIDPDIPLTLGIIAVILGGIAVILEIRADKRIRKLLEEIGRGQIQEKIAMVYDHTDTVTKWEKGSKEKNFYKMERIRHDIRAVESMKGSIKGHEDDFGKARNYLLKELEDNGFKDFAIELKSEFEKIIK